MDKELKELRVVWLEQIPLTYASIMKQEWYNVEFMVINCL